MYGTQFRIGTILTVNRGEFEILHPTLLCLYLCKMSYALYIIIYKCLVSLDRLTHSNLL